MSKTDCCGDCGWCKSSIIRFCPIYNKHWITVNGVLVKCPYCGAVQCRSYKCKECKREVRE